MVRLSFVLGVFMLFGGVPVIPEQPPNVIIEEEPEPEPIKVTAEPYWDDTYTITAYTNGYESTGKRKGDKGYGITSSGEPTQEGVTIACPPSVPYYTRIEIEGIGERVCHDTGSAITAKKIDLYIPSLDDALAFGRQQRRVKYLD